MYCRSKNQIQTDPSWNQKAYNFSLTSFIIIKYCFVYHLSTNWTTIINQNRVKMFLPELLIFKKFRVKRIGKYFIRFLTSETFILFSSQHQENNSQSYQRDQWIKQWSAGTKYQVYQSYHHSGYSPGDDGRNRPYHYLLLYVCYTHHPVDHPE